MRFGTGPIRILSLCAGDGRDVFARAGGRDRRCGTRRRWSSSTTSSPTSPDDGSPHDGIEVRHGDAGDWRGSSTFCPSTCCCSAASSATSRSLTFARRSPPCPRCSLQGHGDLDPWPVRPDEDLRPTIRRWFADAGLSEVAFDGDPERFGVGVARKGTGPASTSPATTRLLASFDEPAVEPRLLTAGVWSRAVGSEEETATLHGELDVVEPGSGGAADAHAPDQHRALASPSDAAVIASLQPRPRTHTTLSRDWVGSCRSAITCSMASRSSSDIGPPACWRAFTTSPGGWWPRTAGRQATAR